MFNTIFFRQYLVAFPLEHLVYVLYIIFSHEGAICLIYITLFIVYLVSKIVLPVLASNWDTYFKYQCPLEGNYDWPFISSGRTNLNDMT